MTTTTELPRWDLSNVYSGFDAEDFKSDFEKVTGLIETLESIIEQNKIGRLDTPPTDFKGTAKVLDELLNRFNEVHKLFGTMEAFVYSFVSTDSYNTAAAKKLSEIEMVEVRLRKLATRFQAWIGSFGDTFYKMLDFAPVATEHKLGLEEWIEQAKYLMDSKLEDLAAELGLSGGSVMSKLQGTVTSQLKMPFERDGEVKELPMTIIRNLAMDPDEDIRKRAYEVELKGWESIKESVAFAMNGVKGQGITLAKWRGRDGVLHEALDHNRIDRDTLNALLEAMKDSFPTFRKYLKSKAKKLCKDKLPWWDLLAPMGKVKAKYTYEEASDYIVEQFNKFTPELGGFARMAIDKNWIDVGPRDGKRGGAFCMGVPQVEESRILANFDGTFEWLTTLAHELGHAYHNFQQKGLPVLRRGAPMTIAETASNFCETIVFNAALNEATPEQQLSILENQLTGANQVIVDIYSRFIFESEVIKRREKSEVSADEMCEIMLEAQKEAYGDGIDENHLHPYMWLLKPHYYSSGAHFYNYPYAFGLLFGLGMYAIYQKEGDSFIPRYHGLLRSTGEGKVADLVAKFGIDVRSKDFWAGSLKLYEGQVEKYAAL
ncbi:MAG: M3 family oligoendopeptidase [bacterium]|nr:M3 family oligoendopeptidase [bacterium]